MDSRQKVIAGLSFVVKNSIIVRGLDEPKRQRAHAGIYSVKRWPIGARRAAEKAEESETDVGS